MKKLSIIAITLMTALAGVPAMAERQAIDVEVRAPFEPATALGLIITADRTIEKVDPPRKKTPDGTYVVSVPYSQSEVDINSFATAILFSDKDLAMGNLKQILPGAPQNSALLLPECPAADKPQLAKIGLEQLPLLENLVKVRAERRETLKAKITTYDENGFLDRLRKLEKGFGLESMPPLSPSLPPAVLADRLHRLNAVITAHDLAKGTDGTAALSK